MINNKAIKKIFGSNTRVKLLDLFFNNQDQQYYVREITRVIDEQINSVRRELNNLHQIGLIKKTEKNRKLYYSLNKKFEFYEALLAIFEKGYRPVRKKQKTLDWGQEISSIQDVMTTVYIGGQFMGVDGKVDLLLVGDNKNDLVSQWANNLEQKFDKTIKYVIISPEDFRYRQAVKDKFLTDFMESKVKKVY